MNEKYVYNKDEQRILDILVAKNELEICVADALKKFIDKTGITPKVKIIEIPVSCGTFLEIKFNIEF